MDLESLSVDELKALKAQRAGGTSAAPKAIDLEDLSVDELVQLKRDLGSGSLEKPNWAQSAGKAVMGGVVDAGLFVDSIAGGPTRAAIGAIQNKQYPFSAIADKFGDAAAPAPTGKDISLKAGISDDPLVKFKGSNVVDAASRLFGPAGPLLRLAGNKLLPESFTQKEFQPSPADISGLAVDVLADPTNILPGVAAAKMAGRGVMAGAKGAGRLASPLIRGVGELATKAPGAKSVIAGSKAIGDTAGAVKSALNSVFKATQADDYPKMLEVAQKHGIDPALLPESVEFGDTSFVSRASRNLREGPLGQPELEKFEKGYQAVQEATNNTIAKVSGGPPLSDIQAGALIRQGYDDAVERLFNDVDFTYNQVIDSAPGIRLAPESAAAIESKLAGIEKFAKGRVARGITNTEKAQGQQLLNAVAAVRAGNGSLKQTYEAMTEIGRHAFKKGQNALSDVPVDQKKFQDLYFTLRDEFLNSTSKHLGDDVAQRLVDSNQLITNFNENKNVLASLIGNKTIAPEQLFNSLIMRGDSKRIGALKEILSHEQLQQLKGSVLENLIKRDPDGAFNFRTLHSAMRNRRNVLESLFSPEELVEFGEIVKLGDRFGSPVLSSSGTGASNLFRDLAKGIGDNAVTRSVVTGLKESARGRMLPENAPKVLLPPGPSAKQGFSMPRRGRGEEATKLLQMIGATGASNQKEEQNAVQRRLEEIVRRRAGQ